MTRKKTPTDGAIAGSAVDLDDGEAVVVETHNTRTIRRQKTPTPAAEDVITVDLDDHDDDDEPTEQRRYSDNSLAALVYDEPNDGIEEQYCTINVRRNPDSMNDRFRTPNTALSHLPRFMNVSLSTDREDIHDMVRRQYGGGHYFFQIHVNGVLGPSWKVTIADLPETAQPAPAVSPSQPAAPAETPAPAPPVNPFDQMIDSMTKQKQLKDLLFGDDRARMEKELADLKAEAERLRAERNTAPTEPPNERLAILEKALGVNNPTIQERMLESVFPAEEGGHWLPETMKTIFEHKDEIGSLVGAVLGGLFGGAPAPAASAPQPDLAAFMRQPAPATATPSRFGRRPEPKPELAPAVSPIGPPAAERPSPAPPSVEFTDNVSIYAPPADFVPFMEPADLTTDDDKAIDAEVVTDTPTAGTDTGTDAEASAAKPKRKGATKK